MPGGFRLTLFPTWKLSSDPMETAYAWKIESPCNLGAITMSAAAVSVPSVALYVQGAGAARVVGAPSLVAVHTIALAIDVVPVRFLWHHTKVSKAERRERVVRLARAAKCSSAQAASTAQLELPSCATSVQGCIPSMTLLGQVRMLSPPGMMRGAYAVPGVLGSRSKSSWHPTNIQPSGRNSEVIAS
eukprot:scaffold265040_cov28-Tisochrysis_lutea.AAC.4